MTDCKRPAYVEVTPTVGVAFIAALNQMTSIKNCNCSILTKESEVEEIRRYFNAILELSKSDNDFPINLDEVCMLVYAQKSDAVAALRANFIEDVDYKVLRQNPQNPQGGRPVNEYRLSISCLEFFIARKVRPVFEVYRQVFHKVARRELSRKELALMVVQAEEERERLALDNKRLETELDAAKPAVTFTNAFSGTESSCLIGELAKIIAQNGYPIGEKRLFQWMRDNGYLGKYGERYNVPNQQYIEQGLFKVKKGVRSGTGGVLHTTFTTKVTGKGQVYFVNKFLNKGN